MPWRMTPIQLDAFRPAGKALGILLAEAGNPFIQAGLCHLVERASFFGNHTAARQRSIRPAHISCLTAFR